MWAEQSSYFHSAQQNGKIEMQGKVTFPTLNVKWVENEWLGILELMLMLNVSEGGLRHTWGCKCQHIILKILHTNFPIQGFSHC